MGSGLARGAGSDLLGAVFGLASAAGWGTGDFTGGVASRRSQIYTIVLVSEIVGLLLLLGLALLLAEPIPSMVDLLWGGAAGVAGTLGLLALYRGLVLGRMGVVAAVAAVVTAAVPLVFGLFLEGIPAARQLLGFGLGLVAVWLLSRSGGGAWIQRRELGLPLMAGLGFGLFLILIDHVSEAAILWPLAAARIASVAMLLAAMALVRQGEKPALAHLPLMVLTGVFDTAGNACYALAAQVGRLDMAAVLSSL